MKIWCARSVFYLPLTQLNALTAKISFVLGASKNGEKETNRYNY